MTRKDRERTYTVLMCALSQERLPWAVRRVRMREIWEACFG